MTDTIPCSPAQRDHGALVARLRSPTSLALLGVLVMAAGLRAYRLLTGIPYAVGIDEPAIVDRVLRIVRTGDLNPHFFDYPSLVFYVQAAGALVRFPAGVLLNEWHSIGQMDATSLYAVGRTIALVVSIAGIYFTYRAGKELDGAWTGIIGAALVAVYPQHVRESHFILTDVPSTTFVALALWFAFRAARSPCVRNFAVAGAAAGLAAASKYNGAFVIVPVVLLVAMSDLRPRRAMLAGAAAIASMVAVFVVVDPWVILDTRGFLEGFAALVGRFELARNLAEPAWMTYSKHLGRVADGWLPAAGAGALLALAFGNRRRQWLAVVVFIAGYFYILSTHPPVYARYALPLVPAVCLCVAYCLVATTGWFRQRGTPWRVAADASRVILTLWFVSSLGHTSVDWLRQLDHPDTREIAAAWLLAAAAPGSRVAVENFGPTNLDHAGFEVIQNSGLLDNSVEWYRAHHCEYLVVSWTRLPDLAGLLANTTVVFHPVHSVTQRGPDVQILHLSDRRAPLVISTSR